MTNLESRVFRLEGQFKALDKLTASLQSQVGAAQANQIAQAAGGGSGGGGAAPGGFTAYPSSIIAAGGNASLAVTQWVAGVGTVVGTFTVYNIGSAATVAGNGTSTFALLLVPDASGGFNIYDQCCS
jgi:hypothetical protein